MPFEKGDPNINRKGRTSKRETSSGKSTNREDRQKELLMLLRKFRPHIAEAVMTAANIMRNEKAVESNRLRAATLLLDNYKSLTLEVFNPRDDEVDDPNDKDNEDDAPVLSLKVVGQ